MCPALPAATHEDPPLRLCKLYIVNSLGRDIPTGPAGCRIFWKTVLQKEGPMLEILRIPISKADLLKMPAAERSLFLLLGYASNQVNTLWKLIIIATNPSNRDPVEERVSGAQTQILVRLLIGVMREALKLVEKRFLGSPVGKHLCRSSMLRLPKRWSS